MPSSRCSAVFRLRAAQAVAWVGMGACFTLGLVCAVSDDLVIAVLCLSASIAAAAAVAVLNNRLKAGSK